MDKKQITVHHFDVDDAKQYGIDAAIFLYNIRFWLTKNKANKKHIHDGYYWTYNSVKAFSELFPYWTPNQINYVIKKLKDINKIKIGNYNKISYDRTNWYTITDEFFVEEADDEIHHSICENSKIDSEKITNGSVKIHQPIPDINTYIKTTYSNQSDQMKNDLTDQIGSSQKEDNISHQDTGNSLQNNNPPLNENDTCNIPQNNIPSDATSPVSVPPLTQKDYYNKYLPEIADHAWQKLIIECNEKGLTDASVEDVLKLTWKYAKKNKYGYFRKSCADRIANGQYTMPDETITDDQINRRYQRTLQQTKKGISRDQFFELLSEIESTSDFNKLLHHSKHLFSVQFLMDVKNNIMDSGKSFSGGIWIDEVEKIVPQEMWKAFMRNATTYGYGLRLQHKN